MQKKIGFIGLGKMGLPMALNLCKKGYPVMVCSRNSESQKTIVEAGGGAIESIQEMGRVCDVVITIIPADNEIRSVYMGEDGILSRAKKNLICIDMTSAKGTTKVAVANYIEEIGKKVQFIDAPVSGGVKGAVDGTLTIMVGSTDKQFEEINGLLRTMGTKIIHTGKVGSGSNIKMLNQILNAANTAIAAEVLCLSRKLGVEDKVLSEVINQSSGGSYIFEKNVPKYMMTGDHTPGFKLDLMKKDVGLFIDTAKEMKLFSPVANLIYQVYEATANQGFGDKNYTSIYSWYEENQKKENKS